MHPVVDLANSSGELGNPFLLGPAPKVKTGQNPGVMLWLNFAYLVVTSTRCKVALFVTSSWYELLLHLTDGYDHMCEKLFISFPYNEGLWL